MRRQRWAAPVLGMALAVAGCGTADETAEQPHGYVEGAAEASEAQSAIAYAARGSQRLGLLDLASEQEKEIGLTVPAAEITEDGRFVYVTDGDRTLEIVDSGVWTVDHTDHVHYYRAPAKTLGTITFDQPVRTVTGGGAFTAVGLSDGRIRVLDRKQLEEGRIADLTTIDSGSATALAIPYAESLLVAVGGDQNRIVAMDATGRATGALDTPCESPKAGVVLRSGAMINCKDFLVRVKQADGKLTAQAVDAAVPAGVFGHRPRSNEAAVADSDGIWSVNAAKATAQRVPSDGRELVTAASPADTRTVLALDDKGTLISYDLKSGKKIAESALNATVLTLDISRAYLSEPAARVIHEIDYADQLRTARTLRTAEQPDLMVEVGR